MSRRAIIPALCFAAAATCLATAVAYAVKGGNIMLASESVGTGGMFVATLGFLGACTLVAAGLLYRQWNTFDPRVVAFGISALAAAYTAANGFGLAAVRGCQLIGAPVTLHLAGLATGGTLFVAGLSELLRPAQTSTEASPRA